MSDLHAAVQAEIDAFRPGQPPPFEDLLARRRAADRRNRAAVAVSACLAVAAVAAAGATGVLGGGQDRLSPLAEPNPVTDAPVRKGPAPYRSAYSIRYDSTSDYETAARQVSACLALPGTSDISALYSLPPIVNVTVTGLREAEAFEACVRRIPGAILTAARPAVADRPARAHADPSRSRAAFIPFPAPEPGEQIGYEMARAQGVLGGDPATGCLWLTGRAGARGQLLVMHDTAVADFSVSPFVIRDGERLIATEGDPLELTGGTAPDGYQGAVPGCPAGDQPFIGRLAG